MCGVGGDSQISPILRGFDDYHPSFAQLLQVVAFPSILYLTIGITAKQS